MPKPAEKPRPLKISTDVKQDEKKTQQICLSPSWSDHGEKARKKERRKAEKEQKERGKKLRSDEELQRSTESKAGKRLSKKPPPAAMETQKMPTALRRGSWISMLSSQTSSGDNSRRSSKDEGRLSGMSFDSIRSRRSRSTPATSTDSAPATAGASEHWKPIVSPSAPKLPSFRWSSSRKSSNEGRKLASPESAEVYEKDFLAFAYRLDSSDIATENNSPKRHDLRDGSPPKASSGAPTFSRSVTEPNLMSVPYHSVISGSPPHTSDANGHSSEREKSIETVSRNSSPSFVAGDDQLSTSTVPQTQMRPSNDGSSYVQKQRMYQQQQSIAGYEDQQAVKDATERAIELAAEREAMLGDNRGITAERVELSGSTAPVEANAAKSHGKNSSTSTVYTKQKNRSRSPPGDVASSNTSATKSSSPVKSMSPVPAPCEKDQKYKMGKQKNQMRSPDRDVALGNTPTANNNSPVKSVVPISVPSEKEHRNEAPKPVQSSKESQTATKQQITPEPKLEKILGFRRRSKQPPASLSVPYGVENNVEAVQTHHFDPQLPHRLDPQQSDEPVVKRSKIERMFREPKPPFAVKERRSSSSSNSKQASPASTPTQNKSRTDKVSAEITNSATSSLPRSATESDLDKAGAHAGSDRSAQNPQSTKVGPVKDGMKPHKSRRPESSTVVGSNPDVKPGREIKSILKANDNKAANDADLSKEKPTKKQAHEIVVESENGEGLIRKTSITRPRSNPQLTTQSSVSSPLPSTDFLPPLKHQPLVKKERQSPTRPTPTDTTTVTISQFKESIAPLAYEPTYAPDLKLIPRSPFRPPSQFPVPGANRINRSSTDIGTVAFGKGSPLTDQGVDAKPVAKLFVICCKCKFWHDLPSKLYEAMSLPLELHKAEKGKVAGARLETAVKCPWCEHAMTTSCCQGWTTVVYLHERHH